MKLILLIYLLIFTFSFSDIKKVELFRERNNFQTLMDISEYEKKYEKEGYKLIKKDYVNTTKGVFITLSFEKSFDKGGGVFENSSVFFGWWR